jgi:SAM-dependent methyltransferase
MILTIRHGLTLACNAPFWRRGGPSLLVLDRALERRSQCEVPERLVGCGPWRCSPPGWRSSLGCGNGRNSTYLASVGCTVDAVDFSAQATEWAAERADAAGVPVGFQNCSIFEAEVDDGSYDLVYDSGCFHHIAPHRRFDYVQLVTRALRPGGSFGLVCFRPEAGSGLTDQEVYERRTLGGGLGYSEGELRALFDRAPFSVQLISQMDKTDGQGPCFGEDFLWTLLATRNDSAT